MTTYMKPEDAAKLLPFGNADWVRNQLRKGNLEGAKVGGRWLVTAESVHAMVEAGTNSTTRRRRRRAA